MPFKTLGLENNNHMQQGTKNVGRVLKHNAFGEDLQNTMIIILLIWEVRAIDLKKDTD